MGYIQSLWLPFFQTTTVPDGLFFLLVLGPLWLQKHILILTFQSSVGVIEPHFSIRLSKSRVMTIKSPSLHVFVSVLLGENHQVIVKIVCFFGKLSLFFPQSLVFVVHVSPNDHYLDFQFLMLKRLFGLLRPGRHKDSSGLEEPPVVVVSDSNSSSSAELSSPAGSEQQDSEGESRAALVRLPQAGYHSELLWPSVFESDHHPYRFFAVAAVRIFETEAIRHGLEPGTTQVTRWTTTRSGGQDLSA